MCHVLKSKIDLADDEDDDQEEEEEDGNDMEEEDDSAKNKPNAASGWKRKHQEDEEEDIEAKYDLQDYDNDDEIGTPRIFVLKLFAFPDSNIFV